MFHITAAYLRRAALRLLALAGLIVLMGGLVVFEREGISSLDEAIAQISAEVPTMVTFLLAGCGFVLACTLNPIIALLLSGRPSQPLALVSKHEASRFAPEQILTLRIDFSPEPDGALVFGAFYSSKTEIPRERILGALGFLALVAAHLPFLPLAVDLGSLQTIVNWVVGTTAFAFGAIALWHYSGKSLATPAVE